MVGVGGGGFGVAGAEGEAGWASHGLVKRRGSRWSAGRVSHQWANMPPRPTAGSWAGSPTPRAAIPCRRRGRRGGEVVGGGHARLRRGRRSCPVRAGGRSWRASCEELGEGDRGAAGLAGEHVGGLARRGEPEDRAVARAWSVDGRGRRRWSCRCRRARRPARASLVTGHGGGCDAGSGRIDRAAARSTARSAQASRRASSSQTAVVVRRRSVTCSLTRPPVAPHARPGARRADASSRQRAGGSVGELVDERDHLGATVAAVVGEEGGDVAGEVGSGATSLTRPRPGEGGWPRAPRRSACGSDRDRTGERSRDPSRSRTTLRPPRRCQRPRLACEPVRASTAVDLGGPAGGDRARRSSSAIVRGSGSAPSCSSLHRPISSASFASTCRLRFENTSRTVLRDAGQVGVPAPSGIGSQPTPSRCGELGAEGGVVDPADRALLAASRTGRRATATCRSGPGPSTRSSRGCAAAGRRPARCAGGTPPPSAPGVDLVDAVLARRVTAPCASNQPSAASTAASWAARTSARTYRSGDSAHSAETDFGAENVASNPRADESPNDRPKLGPVRGVAGRRATARSSSPATSPATPRAGVPAPHQRPGGLVGVEVVVDRATPAPRGPVLGEAGVVVDERTGDGRRSPSGSSPGRPSGSHRSRCTRLC